MDKIKRPTSDTLGDLLDELAERHPEKQAIIFGGHRGVEGMRHLAKNGLRYPYPPYSAFADPADGMSKSYN